MISQNGFLLSFIKYGENDAILHCFTEDDGFQTYFLKGIYTKKNKKKAFLLPLNNLNITVGSNKNTAIKTISKFEIAQLSDIYTDIKANAVIFFVADFLNHILRSEDKNISIFREMEVLIKQLESKNYSSHFVFLLIILRIQGVAPLLGEGNFLDPETGTFSHIETHHFFNDQTSLIWKTILTETNPYEIKIAQSQRKNFLDSVLIYYHYHVTDFRTPDSLEVLQQIFE